MLAAGQGRALDGAALAGLRRRVSGLVREAAVHVRDEAGMEPGTEAELLVVDRRAWIAGNVRTLRGLFQDGVGSGAESTVLAWEGGLFLGLLARAVLAQYDPFRDVLLVVYPNLGDLGEGDGLRWLVLHEVTHLAQFHTAPWMSRYIVELGNEALRLEDPHWLREALRRAVTGLPELARWTRQALQGQGVDSTPLLDLLPPRQRETVLRLHALLTLLEGHATYVTDRISARLLPDYPRLQQRLRERRRRPPLVRLLEAVAGLEMKRQQYVLGRGFCEGVWERGGASALGPAWERPDNLPTAEELRDPDRWLARVGRGGRPPEPEVSGPATP